MEQNGGCCIARSYTNHAHNNNNNNISKVDHMMLTRFRPIAPKPSSPTTNFHVTTDNKTNKPTGRGKRRNPNSNNGTARKRKSPSPENSADHVKTLSLLPEAPGLKDNNTPCKKNFPKWLSFGNNNNNNPIMDHVPCDKLLFKTGSLVKVECEMEKWMVSGTEGCTDEERVMRLDNDTCPCFITDGLNRVTWTNAAYKRMVGGEGEVAVVPVGVAGFTSHVRVFGKGSITVPCDVWRMECGGFAWRLDTTVALSLG